MAIEDCPSRADLESFELHGTGRLADHLQMCDECSQRLRLITGLRRFGMSPSAVLDGSQPRLWQVYVDESGTNTPDFSDKKYPSLTLAAVVTTAEKLIAIDTVRASVARRAGLDPSTEIHASPCLHNQEAFEGLPLETREDILWQFVERNSDNFLFFYALDMVKPMVRQEIQRGLAERGFSQYTAIFLHLLTTVGKFIELVLHGRFEVFLDRNDAVLSDLFRVAERVRRHENERLRIEALHSDLTALESRESSALQLADVIAHYAGRYHRIEIPAFDHGPALDRFREKIERFHRVLLRPKDLPGLIPEVYMNVDWKAMQRMDLLA